MIVYVKHFNFGTSPTKAHSSGYVRNFESPPMESVLIDRF